MSKILVHFDPKGANPNFNNGTDDLLMFDTNTKLFVSYKRYDLQKFPGSSSISLADETDFKYYNPANSLDVFANNLPTTPQTHIPDLSGTTIHSYCDGTDLKELAIAGSGTLDKWDSGTTYNITNNPVYVVHEGNLYRLVKNGTSTNEEPTQKLVNSSSTEIWYQVSRDYAGDNWVSSVTYTQGTNDIKYWSNSGWRLLVASDTGTQPGTDPATWEQLNDPDIVDDTLTTTTTANSVLCGGTYYSINILSIAQTPNPPTDTAITINATSDFAPLEYSLDGSVFQASNSFTVTASGDYIAYVRDDAGYIAQEVFTVADITGTQYGVRFRHEHKDNDDATIRYDIEEKDYAGSITSIDMAKGGEITYNKDGDDLYEPIKSSDCQLTVWADTNFQFSDFFTATDDKFRLSVYKDSTLFWQGFYPPESHQETYGDVPYDVDLDFTDYIAKLKEIDFIFSEDTNGGVAQGLQSQIYIIAKCLQQTGLFLNINVSIDIFEENHNTASTDTPLAQTYMDLRAFIVEETLEDSTAMNCYEVLSELLKSYGARVYQRDGEWWINTLDQYIKSSIDYVVYDPYGTQTSTTSVSPALAMTSNTASPTVRHVSGDGTIEILPAWDSVTFNQLLTPFLNLIANGNFETLDPQGGVFANWNDEFGILSNNQGSAVLSGDGADDGWTKYIQPDNNYLWTGNNSQLSFGISLHVKATDDITGDLATGTIKIKIQIKVGSYYWTPSGNWSTNEGDVIVALPGANSDVSFSLTSTALPAPGTMEIKIYNAKSFTTDVSVEEMRLSAFVVRFFNGDIEFPESKALTMVNDQGFKYKGDEIDMAFGDISPYTKNQLFFKNGFYLTSNGDTLTEYWKRTDVDDELENLLQIVLLRQLNQRQLPRQLFTVDIHTIGTEIKFDNLITDPNNVGKSFIINGMSFDIEEKIYKLELIEVASSEDEEFYRIFEDGTKERITEKINPEELRLLE